MHYGETPYHPGRRRRKGPRPHPAKTVPGRLRLDDRPAGAGTRSELGHLEMDYASYEKGSVENCNRLVRRWYPKGADFSPCTRGDIRRLEETINGIHRLSLGGKTAAQFEAELAGAA